MATPDLIRLDIVVDEEQYDTVAGLLVRNISYGWEEDSLPTGETRFRVHCDNAIVQENLLSALRAWLPGLDVEQTSIPRQDWTVAWREFFTPVRAGQFIVLPPWLLESTPPEGRKPIIIEPKSAFGTGHHNTTVLCLEAITELLASGRLKAGQRFFDVGTGSGILGIACCLNGLTGSARTSIRSPWTTPLRTWSSIRWPTISASSPAVPRRAKASGSIWWSPTSSPVRSANWPRRLWPG